MPAIARDERSIVPRERLLRARERERERGSVPQQRGWIRQAARVEERGDRRERSQRERERALRREDSAHGRGKIVAQPEHGVHDVEARQTCREREHEQDRELDRGVQHAELAPAERAHHGAVDDAAEDDDERDAHPRHRDAADCMTSFGAQQERGVVPHRAQSRYLNASSSPWKMLFSV
jgi:hypothetical protein